VALTYSQRKCGRKVSPMADLKLRLASHCWVLIIALRLPCQRSLFSIEILRDLLE
jgi:hypothetical protein